MRKAGFSGEISHDAGNRIVFGTDNSVYQMAPEAVLFPRTARDLSHVAQALASRDYPGVCFRPRGGGTSTSAASLGEGLRSTCSGS